MKPVTRMLVATDFSNAANHSVDYAARLAVALAVPLHVVHVYEPLTLVTPEGVAFAPAHDDAQIRAELGRSLEQAAARARAQGANDVATELVTGAAWTEILRVADARDCDLIVLSTHGRGGVPRLLLGSVADKVVRKAACPVVTIGPRA
jgi:nucleotide-binding universal stress UspA family protein